VSVAVRTIEFGQIRIITIERGKPVSIALWVKLNLRIEHIQLHPRAHA
jgi:hypothetical protein